jgi:hypothetical protein
MKSINVANVNVVLVKGSTNNSYVGLRNGTTKVLITVDDLITKIEVSDKDLEVIKYIKTEMAPYANIVKTDKGYKFHISQFTKKGEIEGFNMFDSEEAFETMMAFV